MSNIKKIVFIISYINRAQQFEWIAEKLDKKKFSQYYILLNPAGSYMEEYLKEQAIPVFTIPYNGKKKIIPAFLKIFFFLRKIKPDIVHTHLFDASLCGLSAARLLGIKKRIHTRHHSTSNQVYYPKAVKYDKLINYLSTDIIAISNNVKEVLINKENVSGDKITLIHHGFNMESFVDIRAERIKNLKVKYHINSEQPVIGVISRFIHLKGIQYIIPAFKQLISIYPEALLILCNTKGNYKSEIEVLLKQIPSKNYCEIIFENDPFALYKLFDIFVHVPIDEHTEAFGQTYVESLALGVPSVFTLSGIASEFIMHEKNALVVNYQDSTQIYEAIIKLLSNKQLASRLIEQGKADVFEKFPIEKTIQLFEKLYEE